MVNPNMIRNVLGIIGNVISFGLFLSPVPAFWRIIKNKSVEQFKPDPYLATLLNCALWVLYGLPIVKQNNILVTTINGIGFGIELIYITIFLLYSDSKKRRWISLWLGVEALFYAVVLIVTLVPIHTLATRTIVVGAFCVVFNVCMYASPLTVWRQVVQTKSVKYMPFWLSLTSFLNGAIWTGYACILKVDPWMVVPNGLGTLFGAIQLILYGCYYKSTVWEEEDAAAGVKPSDIEMPPVRTAEP